MDSPSELNELAAKRVGQVLVDKWRLERVLGMGGMATVYAASHRNNLRAVAIKLLHPELAANAELRKRFLREGYIANKVGHPGAVAVLDDGVGEDGSVFLVMDLLVGESLHQHQVAARGVLPADEALRIADGVLEVLIAAHEQGIVHRDLKPDNVFLTTDGSVKVLDFGIARLVDPESGERATQTGVMIGTPAYMPPEQARGRSKLVDERSDIWALGAILFTLLTGRHVHEGETPNEVLLKAMTEPAPALASIVPGVNPAVAALIDKALSVDAAERWQDARAMRAAVREARATVDPMAARNDADLMLATGTTQARSMLTPVSKGPVTSVPIVRDVGAGGPRAGKMLAAALLIGAFAFGASLFFRSRSHGAVAAIDGGAGAPTSSTTPTLTSTTLTDASDVSRSDASTPEDSGADANADAAALAADLDADVDADDEEDEEDDGGEELDELVDAGHALAHPLPKGHAAPKGHPTRHKPTKRKKKRR